MTAPPAFSFSNFFVKPKPAGSFKQCLFALILLCRDLALSWYHGRAFTLEICTAMLGTVGTGQSARPQEARLTSWKGFLMTTTGTLSMTMRPPSSVHVWIFALHVFFFLLFSLR